MHFNSTKKLLLYKSFALILNLKIKKKYFKDKKLDDLTKQVIRFKRIQEIVLSAQSNLNNQIKNKSNFEY